ncbi:unnamed protein product [Eruca vesicaria subsp. sativa]|uniref:Uncharacterized protein n=1 Tax=Eruca vesicaria subsp. sativa TaxID=29727 RepID=A0ABC8LDC9_ERUVS|nr:unnamed protein product [Eruca vesicaria subsp. sativa]
MSVNGLLVLPDEKGIGSPQRSNSVDSLKVESPTRKGFGLKKWRRIRRDGPVKEEVTTPGDDDGSKLLKRGLTGLVNPPLKHVDLSSVEARQSSEGSVGSVNMAVPNHHHLLPGVANGFSVDPGFMFNVGQGFEKSEDHSGNSVAAKNVVVGGGKIVSGSQGKIWRDTIKNASQKPCSSMDSDLRSSDFVFSSAAKIHGENEESKEVQTYSRNQNGEEDENGDDGCKKNNHYCADKDQIADSIRSLAALHDALCQELKSFQELGNESIPLHSNIDEVNSSDKPRSENTSEEKSTSSGSQVLILKQKIKHLQHKLEEARADLDAKEARIQELEYSKIESELEGIFQRKIEAEIHHLVLTRSLSSPLQLLKEQPTKIHSLTEDPEPNRGNILRKTCKSSFYFLTQLILLVSILRLLVLQCSPASRLVIPT